MLLIADSSALVALSVCDSLELLDQLFKEVIVPESVYLEVIKSDKPEALALKEFLQEKVRKVDMSAFIYLDGNADEGEMEAMFLYKKEQADKLLIDDKRGKKLPKLMGLIQLVLSVYC